jgi:nitroreductase/dihydropteridine reductase
MSPQQAQTSALINQALNRRYATKQYQKNSPIDPKIIEALIDAWRMAPSSFGLDPVRFIIVQDQATKELLLPHAYNQPQITDASALIILATETMSTEYINQYISHVAQTRNVSIDSLHSYKEMISEVTEMQEQERHMRENEQVHIALWCMLLTAAQLAIDTTPMGWFIPEKFDEVLWLTGTSLRSVVVLAVWYRDTQDGYATLKKVRRPRDIAIVTRKE